MHAQEPDAENEQQTGDEIERDVILNLHWAGPNMMNLQNVMINDSLKQIENPASE
ncbi:hypothetical protein GCM10025858_26280 [Alicyclobacillus sacchari]|nr:hypothetical protein GCM10025858_26280 [Alicyclobacillus sacchari]